MRFVILALALVGFAACKPSGSCPDGSEPITAPNAPFFPEIFKNQTAGTEVICRKGAQAHGLATYWYANGQKQMEGEHLKDNRHGKWTYWDDDGRKRWETEYLNGYRHGKHTSWAWDFLKTEGWHKAGENHGKWIIYNTNTNRRVRETEYDNGTVIKRSCWHWRTGKSEECTNSD